MSQPNLEGKRVLLVDDDSDILTSMQAAFEPTGATVETASNGNKAVEIAERTQPDLVVLDEPSSLPEGTEVEVVPVNPELAPADPLANVIGKAQNLPPDASRNKRHYLYGHPKGE